VAAPPKFTLRAEKAHEKYGVFVPKGGSLLALELQCYRENRGAELGGLGQLEHFKRAWRLAWPNFAWNDWVEMLVAAWCESRMVVVIGHTRASKTYGTAHAAFLDYCAAPAETMTSLTTVTFEGLKLRMWADLMMAMESASFPAMGMFDARASSNEMKVKPAGAGKADDKFIMEGFATSRTKDSAGRIQGKHARRRRVILDEAQELPDLVYRALANAKSAPDFKGVLLANPVDKLTEFGAQCEPEGGWGSVHDSDLVWRTKDGGTCLHFDGLQSPNVKAGKVIFDFMIRPDYIEEIRRNYGEDSLEWWMYVRGFFPPDGTVSRVWGETMIDRVKPGLAFDFAPVRCASLDPAFEHDDCALIFADRGKLRDGQHALNCVKSEKVPVKSGRGVEPKDYQIAHAVMARCREEKVAPADFIMDKTGGGRGVFAILQKEWSYEIHGIDYGGAATARALKVGETDKCEDMFDRFVSELWFRTRAFAEEGLLGGLGNLDAKTEQDLAARRYAVRKTGERSKQAVETKTEMKKRLGRSPDFGDAFCQLGELMARKGLLPGKKAANQGPSARWAASRKAAVRACKRYSEAGEFAHF
jgi:hypothetical protein